MYGTKDGKALRSAVFRSQIALIPAVLTTDTCVTPISAVPGGEVLETNDSEAAASTEVFSNPLLVGSGGGIANGPVTPGGQAPGEADEDVIGRKIEEGECRGRVSQAEREGMEFFSHVCCPALSVWRVFPCVALRWVWSFADGGTVVVGQGTFWRSSSGRPPRSSRSSGCSSSMIR
jgi:hypothetical protein